MQKVLQKWDSQFAGIIRTIIILSLIFIFENKMSARNELDVIRNSWLEYSDAPNSLYHYLTDQSDGGTQSAYIAAFDDRIYAAATENYITNYRRLHQTKGPRDAEQNMFNILNRGLDHPDFLIVRAPKPALMICKLLKLHMKEEMQETG